MMKDHRYCQGAHAPALLGVWSSSLLHVLWGVEGPHVKQCTGRHCAEISHK